MKRRHTKRPSTAATLRSLHRAERQIRSFLVRQRTGVWHSRATHVPGRLLATSKLRNKR